MVEGCPLVVDHHADYSTTQRERFIQENLGELLVSPKLARGLLGLVTSWPCAVGLRISSIPGFIFTSSLSNFSEMLRTQAIQEWSEVCQADPFKSEVFGTWW